MDSGYNINLLDNSFTVLNLRVIFPQVGVQTPLQWTRDISSSMCHKVFVLHSHLDVSFRHE